jgi:hypothetical protein
MIIPGEPMFSWGRDIAQFLGGLLMLAIVGVLSVASLAWSWWTSRRR